MVKRISLIVSQIIILGVILSFIGCDIFVLTDDTPDYVGTWKRSFEYSMGSETGTAWQQVKFEKGYYTAITSENENLVPIGEGVRGPIEVDGNTITFRANESWSSENEQWESMDTTASTALYSVSGNTIKITEEGSTTLEFTKQ